MANIKDLIKSIEAADSSFDEKLAAINQMEETLVAMRQQEEQAVQDNVDLIVEAIKVMERKVENQLEIAKSIVPEKGDKGDKGERGLDGANGRDGKDGRDGINGRDGQDGQDGVSVTDAKIDFDGSLIITLSTGQEINVGEVVAPELQEKIKLVTSGGAGTVLPEQTGNANKYLKTSGTTLSWDTLDGSDINLASPPTIGNTTPNTGAFTTLSASSTVSGTGFSTYLASPPAIGGTTPAAGTFTTLTAQTEVLNGTGQNLIYPSNPFTSVWNNNEQTVTGSQADPFSGTTATLLVPSTNNTGHYTFNVGGSVFAFTSSSKYTISVYVKASGYTLFYIADVGGGKFACSYDLTAVTATPFVGCTGTITAVSGASGWYRVTLTTTGIPTSSSRLSFAPYPSGATLSNFSATFAGNGTSGAVIYGAQVEFGTTAGVYIATTGAAVYGVPLLSFAGASSIGLQSDGSLYVQPAGTGALQAQATTSTATGGNARGANAVDWQMSRSTAAQVASASTSFIGAGRNNTSSGQDAFVGAGFQNTASGGNQPVIVGGSFNSATAPSTFIGGGQSNVVSRDYSSIVGGYTNGSSSAIGYFNFIGGGANNTATATAAVTTQSATMNGTTAVTLSGSNANIKVGQLITGTSITFPTTYVAAISGTSLTLSQAASGSSTSTLSFFTPHGVVVGGGNNQATGSYSFIGGGGDAGTAANRNTASGDWSAIVGGVHNIASGIGSFIGGGGVDTSGIYASSTASGAASSVVGGFSNTASNIGSSILGGAFNSVTGSYASVIGGYSNTASGSSSSSLSGRYGNTRSINGMAVFSAVAPMGGTTGICQAGLLVIARQTTDATATVLASDVNAASGLNQVALPNNSAYYFRGEVIAGVTGAGNTKGWYVEGVIKRGANAASTALVGTPTVTSLYADAGAATWSITATADTTNGALAITVTGQASTTIRWVAQVRTTEMTY